MHPSPAFAIDLATGLLRGGRQVLSPHRDPRPAGQAPELLVVHGISLPPGEFGGPWIDRLFCGDLPAEAHPGFVAIAGLLRYLRSHPMTIFVVYRLVLAAIVVVYFLAA